VPERVELEERLTQLGNELEWPATPQLVRAVSVRIQAPLRLVRPWYQTRWAAAAAAVLLALAALIAFPPTRDTIARFLNLHALITRTSNLPTPSPLPPGPLGTRLGLGGKTTLGGARGAVKWKVLVPSSLGQPDEVYQQGAPDGPPQGEVTLVYATAPGIKPSGQTGVSVLVTEATGAVDANFFFKVLPPGTTLEEVTVNGHHGYWIAGQPHDFFLIDADGAVRNETLRLATNTLIIDYGGTVVRIEGDMSKQEALQIAASLS
jgi:hypothetical protein